MKIMPLSLLFGMAMLTITGLAQGSQSNPQTLNDILAEVRAIHADVRLSETTQILLAELQLQQNAVNAAVQHRDSLHTNLTQLQDQEKSMAAEIVRLDDPDSEPVLDAARKKQSADQSARLKAMMPAIKSREAQASNDLQDAETRVSSEQRKLNGIQSQLDDVVMRLKPTANP